MCAFLNEQFSKIEAVNLLQSYFRQIKQFCPKHQVSNFHFLQIPVVFSFWPETSMASSWLCILLIPLLINFLLTVRADIFFFAPSLSSAASSEELFLLSARDALFKDLSSQAVVDFLRPCPFLFLKDFVSLYLLIVVEPPSLNIPSSWQFQPENILHQIKQQFVSF